METPEATMDALYTNWCVAEFEADCIYEELDEDFTHPRFLEAQRHSRGLLFDFLRWRTGSLRHVLLKLQIACDCEGYLEDTLDPSCPVVAPHAIIAAATDLEAIIMPRAGNTSR